MLATSLSFAYIYVLFRHTRCLSLSVSRSLLSLHLPHCHTALLRHRLLSPAVHLCFCISLIGDCWVTWTSAYVPYLTPIGALLSVHSRQASSEPWVKVGRCSSNLTGKRNYCLRYNLLIRPSRTAAYSPSWEKKIQHSTVISPWQYQLSPDRFTAWCKPRKHQIKHTSAQEKQHEWEIEKERKKMEVWRNNAKYSV